MFARVADPGKPAFQLRPGEKGISVFDMEGVQPSLSEGEVLAFFRPGSVVVYRSKEEIEAKNLQVFPIQGDESMPTRLRETHAEIRPGTGMKRPAFKQALTELE